MLSYDHIFNTLVGLCEISIWWMIWQEHRARKGQREFTVPTKRWLLMLAISLVPIGALAYYEFHYEPPPEFDAPSNAVVLSWGQEGMVA